MLCRYPVAYGSFFIIIMCGIIGYTGKENALPFVLEGLKALEYRGYDSAGVACLSSSGITTVKASGKVAVLEKKIETLSSTATRNLTTKTAIGHTRWATHGAPTDNNAHPHGNASVMLVHNGIIENWAELKEVLLKDGETLLSDTDTEIASLTIAKAYKKEKDPLKAIKEATKDMRGSFAFAIVFSDIPDTIFATKRQSPLVLGFGKAENFIASDITAFLEHTREFFVLGEEEIAVLTATTVCCFDASLAKINHARQTADWDISEARKGGYPHFMKKEIAEEPTVLRKTLCPRIKNSLPYFAEENIDMHRLTHAKRIIIVACGTALHAGILGKYAFEHLAHLVTTAEIASEFRYASPLLSSEDTVIVVSQSGETADTLAALRLAKEKGAYTLALINVVGSSIAREADGVLYTWGGPEISVASTKAYTVQTSLFYLLGIHLGFLRGKIDEDKAKTLTHALKHDLPRAVEQIIADEDLIKKMAERFTKSAHSLFFLGRGADYAAAMEASLKLKEISYIHCEAYAAGELKHGTISLIEDGTPVIALSTSQKLSEKIASNIREVTARGGKVFVICGHSAGVGNITEATYLLPVLDEFFLPIAEATACQLFAYHAALLRGCAIDQPRNLAKSVTVE